MGRSAQPTHTVACAHMGSPHTGKHLPMLNVSCAHRRLAACTHSPTQLGLQAQPRGSTWGVLLLVGSFIARLALFTRDIYPQQIATRALLFTGDAPSDVLSVAKHREALFNPARVVFLRTKFDAPLGAGCGTTSVAVLDCR